MYSENGKTEPNTTRYYLNYPCITKFNADAARILSE